MSLVQELDQRLRAAMKARDERVTNVLRMVKARIKDYAIDKRIQGEVADSDARQVITTYVKQLRKSIPEFEKGGAAAQEAIARLREEIAYLEPLLPKLLDEDRTREIVLETVRELGNPPPQKGGMVIGHVMKAHAGEVDPVLVRRLVEEALGQ